MISTLKIYVLKEHVEEFACWQGKLNAEIAGYPGFISLEILSQSENKDMCLWMVVDRFKSEAEESSWRASKAYQELRESLVPIALSIEEKVIEFGQTGSNITEVIITRINEKSEADYREWISKLHLAESKFPGFKGVIVQSPHENRGNNWITLLQFDTPAHLDNWINSPERTKILEEGKNVIVSLESHRVISPFAGWFSNIAGIGTVMPVWKQTMIVLLVLFPIIKLEERFLSPYLMDFNSSLAVFLGSALSVSLISWPLMPLAIKGLSWWLTNSERSVLGTVFILVLYLIEISVFWM